MLMPTFPSKWAITNISRYISYIAHTVPYFHAFTHKHVVYNVCVYLQFILGCIYRWWVQWEMWCLAHCDIPQIRFIANVIFIIIFNGLGETYLWIIRLCWMYMLLDVIKWIIHVSQSCIFLNLYFINSLLLEIMYLSTFEIPRYLTRF